MLDDYHFWRLKSDRHYRCRLATQEEIQAHAWLDPARLPAGCFFYCLLHTDRATSPTTTRVFTVSDPMPEQDEDNARRMFRQLYLQLEQRAANG